MDPPRFLASGDVVRIEIEGLGVLEHTIAIGMSAGERQRRALRGRVPAEFLRPRVARESSRAQLVAI